MRNLNDNELNTISGGGDMAPDNMPPNYPPGQDVVETIRRWNAMHPNNPLPIGD